MEDEEETQNCEQLKNMVANHLEKKHALFLLMEICLKKMQTRLKKLADVTRRPSTVLEMFHFHFLGGDICVI